MMSEERGSEPVKPRTCERCGKRMPPQKRGRPRKWCSHQCRQSAYEERNGLSSWAERQPKVESLSDIAEVVQGRAAKRQRFRFTPFSDPGYGPSGLPRVAEPEHDPNGCVATVEWDYILTAVVIHDLANLVRDLGIPNTSDGRWLADSVVGLVQAVLFKAGQVITVDIPDDKTPLSDYLLTDFSLWRPSPASGETS